MCCTRTARSKLMRSARIAGRVEHGLTTVGLKIHCLGDNRELLNLIEALGGRSEVIANRFYAHARASVTVILPPVGSARSAILLLECIEKYFGHPIFHNPRYQIQVCSPCRLDGPRATILAIAFYLGSDGPPALQPRRDGGSGLSTLPDGLTLAS